MFMTPGKLWKSHYVIQLAAAGLMSACWLQAASAAQADAAVNADAAARANWQAALEDNATPEEGCFQASFPNIVWERVECKVAHPRFHPVFHKPAAGDEDVTGNGHDYVAKSVFHIKKTLGSFPTVTDVTHEKSVGVAAFGDDGILGPNEYTLQVNTNYTGTTAACAGNVGCTVWQQFIYSPDYETEGEAAVFMQYWLINWGDSACPVGFGSAGGGDCYGNSNFIAAPDLKVNDASLMNQTLSGSVTATTDTATFNNGAKAYKITGPDAMLDISTVWTESEFNIVGNAGGSRAVFNSGSSVTVNVALTNGHTAAPVCVNNHGSTGETNNLVRGPCTTSGGTNPSIQFTESYTAP
jgi:hypothetical protein